jgi:hypothetical protein
MPMTEPPADLSYVLLSMTIFVKLPLVGLRALGCCVKDRVGAEDYSSLVLLLELSLFPIIEF